MEIFPIWGGEATRLENMEALYASVRTWGIQEEDGTTFTFWNGFDE